LERESILKESILAISGPVDKEALIAKRLDKVHEKFGDKVYSIQILFRQMIIYLDHLYKSHLLKQ